MNGPKIAASNAIFISELASKGDFDRASRYRFQKFNRLQGGVFCERNLKELCDRFLGLGGLE